MLREFGHFPPKEVERKLLEEITELHEEAAIFSENLKSLKMEVVVLLEHIVATLNPIQRVL